MLVLICEAAGKRYAIRAGAVVEVVPKVEIETMAAGADWLAGRFIYRGKPTAVIDLGRLVGENACSDRFSSRIVLVGMPGDAERERVGVLVDRVRTAEIDAHNPEAECGGRAMVDDEGVFQLVELNHLMTDQDRQTLRAATERWGQ